MGLPSLLAVACGGACGAVLRYLCVTGVGRAVPITFPLGTLGVNILGSCLIGFVAGWLSAHNDLSPLVRLFVVVGVLGGFTTFSAFSLEILTMLERGKPGLAFGYAGLSVIGCVLGAGVGAILARHLFGTG